eukprot:TRINITY_DN13267_c0_g1_i1.p1 TRINITY_DN13267_c0_g1~~TRINITY_DN13267_c0_g1_i1.p1  ORF type:complete len:281 (-),score=52.57 TRINITY_DN13267_c0_g1_i1:223-1065(-)
MDNNNELKEELIKSVYSSSKNFDNIKNFVISFLFSGSSAVLSRVFVYPFDLIVSNKLNNNIINHQTNLKHRNVVNNIIKMLLIDNRFFLLNNALMFGFYGITNSVIKVDPKYYNRKKQTIVSFIAGSIAGIAGKAALYPFLNSNSGRVKDAKISSVYKGFLKISIVTGIQNGLYFGIYTYLKNNKENVPFLNLLLFGQISALMPNILKTSFSYVTNEINITKKEGNKLKYQSHHFSNQFRKNGITSFFLKTKFLPSTISSGITLTLFDYLSSKYFGYNFI